MYSPENPELGSEPTLKFQRYIDSISNNFWVSDSHWFLFNSARSKCGRILNFAATRIFRVGLSAKNYASSTSTKSWSQACHFFLNHHLIIWQLWQFSIYFRYNIMKYRTGITENHLIRWCFEVNPLKFPDSFWAEWYFGKGL